MIWMTSKFNSHRNTGLSVESSRHHQPVKMVDQFQEFLGKFWKFSLYYGEFIAGRVDSPQSGQCNRK